MHGKIKSNIFREVNREWENIKYTFNTKAICTERVTAAHTIQATATFWTLKHLTSYQCFSSSKKGKWKGDNYALPRCMKNAYKVLPLPYLMKDI